MKPISRRLVCIVAPCLSALGLHSSAALAIPARTVPRTPTKSTIQRVTADVARSRVVPLELDGRRVTVRLGESTLRRAGFRVLVADASGELHDVAPPATETLSGTVDEIPGSVVAATVHDGAFTATLALGDGRTFVVQPASDFGPASDRAAHVVYLADAEFDDAACTVNEAPVVVTPQPDALEGTTAAAAALKYADLAIDADYEYYQANTSSVSKTVSDVETLINSVNAIYERDCGIRHRLSSVIVRSSASDPYSTASPETLLTQMKNSWNASQTGVTRDMAHLMTGRDLTGSTIGYASVGVVCTKSRAYGLSQSRYSTNLGKRTALVAHELGHNWNANHCNSVTPCNIMCSTIGGCSGLGAPNFEPSGITAIKNFAGSRTCLETGTVAVESGAPAVGVRFEAPQPTPFSHQTTLRYSLDRPGNVSLDVYDVQGHRVAHVAGGVEAAGWHTRTWSGNADDGRRLGAGVYHARLITASGVHAQKLILVR